MSLPWLPLGTVPESYQVDQGGTLSEVLPFTGPQFPCLKSGQGETCSWAQSLTVTNKRQGRNSDLWMARVIIHLKAKDRLGGGLVPRRVSLTRVLPAPALREAVSFSPSPVKVLACLFSQQTHLEHLPCTEAHGGELYVLPVCGQPLLIREASLMG